MHINLYREAYIYLLFRFFFCVMNKITVTALDRKFNCYVKPISAIARKIFLLLKKNGYSFDICLVGNSVIRKINRTYRKKDKVTNVLSFCEPENFIGAPSKYKYLGEIYLGLDFIKANNQDLKLMITHGTLHLLGYDHETEKDRVKMEKKERLILSNMG